MGCMAGQVFGLFGAADVPLTACGGRTVAGLCHVAKSFRSGVLAAEKAVNQSGEAPLTARLAAPTLLPSTRERAFRKERFKTTDGGPCAGHARLDG